MRCASTASGAQTFLNCSGCTRHFQCCRGEITTDRNSSGDEGSVQAHTIGVWLLEGMNVGRSKSVEHVEEEAHHFEFPQRFIPPCKEAEVRRKLRLFEYLFESLCNSEMVSCIQWVDRTRGVFQFISKNKEMLAELWGKRKGNRKPMTYQKMARALRNYARTGEITKIRRKLTYQFSEAVLRRLAPPHFLGKDLFCSQYGQPDQEYLRLNHWNANYYAHASYQS
nr:transcription factor Spi-C [Meriones unguiculatus]